MDKVVRLGKKPQRQVPVSQPVEEGTRQKDHTGENHRPKPRPLLVKMGKEK